MTSDHPLRRLLARVCSPATMSGVVDPILADIRWESGRPAWLGYLALLKALTVHTIVSTPSVLSRAWSEDERAIPKAAAFAIAGAVVAAIPLALPPALATIRWPDSHFSRLVLGLLVAPQALALTLPAALLLAIPLALGRHAPSARLARRTVGLSLCCAVATFALIGWVVPESNQAFRVMVSGDPNLPRGPAEAGFAAQREQIEALNLTPGGRVAARRMEYGYQLRLALAVAPLPLGLVALAIATSRRGRRRPWLAGIAALAVYAGGIYPVFGLVHRLMVRMPDLPAFIFAWGPHVALLAAALALLSRAASQQRAMAVSPTQPD